jgi:hypothetical protein
MSKIFPSYENLLEEARREHPNAPYFPYHHSPEVRAKNKAKAKALGEYVGTDGESGYYCQVCGDDWPYEGNVSPNNSNVNFSTMRKHLTTKRHKQNVLKRQTELAKKTN